MKNKNSLCLKQRIDSAADARQIGYAHSLIALFN
jgi:hypothetical protein